MSETPRQTLKRMHAARDFPQHTCAASRHVALIAEELVKSGVFPNLTEEPEHCGQSMASAVGSLWEARAALAAKDAEIERLRATNEQWSSVETAPTGRPILVAGNGPTRFAYQDERGQWRKIHHRPMDNVPKVWMEIPRFKEPVVA